MQISLSLEADSLSHDVTGGIVSKLKCAANIVHESGVDVYIVQAGTFHASRALSGEKISNEYPGDSDGNVDKSVTKDGKWIGTIVQSSKSSKNK